MSTRLELQTKLSLLAPVIQSAAVEMITKAEKDLGYQLQVVRTWSSHAEQMELYKRGRKLSSAGLWIVDDASKIVTRAIPGTSAHNVVDELNQPASMGLDVIPMSRTTRGVLLWEIEQAYWDKLYTIAWDCGLDPMGDKPGAYLAWDKGHFEEPRWKLKFESWKTYHLP